LQISGIILSTGTASTTDTRKIITIHPSGILLSKFSLIAAAILLILAAWAGQTVLVILLGLVLSAAGLSILWSRLSLKGLSCERHLTEHRAFPGGSLELKLRLVNRKLLPLPWVQVADELPAGFIHDLPVEPGSRPGFETVSQTTSILWYSAINWKYPILCKKRGFYTLGPLTITSGDIFGFYPRTSVERADDHVIVYPKIFGLTHLSVPSLYPIGEAKSEKRLFEDPSRTIGIRDYSPGDSLRRIHWKATARQQHLQVKVYEPSSSLRVALFLAIDSFQNNGIWNYDDLETGISTAASLANYLVEKKSQVGLWSNSRLADSGQPARIPVRSGTDQLVQLLEALAKVVSVPSGPFIDFFLGERKDLLLGTTLIFIFWQLPAKFKEVLSDLRESGYKILMFQINEVDKEELDPDIAWYYIRQPGSLVEINPR
jgi:uncharacterized protein (DUF58 family)